MGAQLKGTVYVTDPDTHQTVELAPGTLPEPRLAALVTNPAAWVDGKLPRLAKAKTENAPKDPEGAGDPTGDDPDAASGDDSEPSADADTEPDAAPSTPDEPAEGAKPAAKKTAARKTAAVKPAAT
ncbi:hypothetical protein AB0L71_28015 [Streptomyces sp. NPDC052052]|uniref:hypothetical protein n=1 Tax=Streptomyces sp. NPDC052052 TaxID=3154756 RepID=UPI00341B64DD